MSDLLTFLNTNSGSLNVIFTGAVTLATIIYAALTARLVTETRELRRVQTEPRVEITAQSLDISINIVRLRIRNIGLGPAFDMAFAPQVVKGGAPAESLLKDFTASSFFTTGLGYLGPGEERFSLYTDMAKDGEGKLDAVLSIDLSYRGASGEVYRHPATIDMTEQKRDYQLGKPHLYAIAQSLEKLQVDVHSFSTGFRRLSVDVFNAEDRAREAEMLRQRRAQAAGGGES